MTLLARALCCDGLCRRLERRVVVFLANAREECFARGDAARRGGSDLSGHARDREVEVVLGRDDFMDETDRKRSRRIEAFARQRERARVRRPDLREYERRNDRGHDAEFRFGEPENRICGGDRDVAARDQARAAAERGAVDAPDHGLSRRVDRAEHARHTARVLEVRFAAEVERCAHPSDVGAAAEALAGSGEDDSANACIGFKELEGRPQLGDQFRVERVAHLGAGERDVRDPSGISNRE